MAKVSHDFARKHSASKPIRAHPRNRLNQDLVVTIGVSVVGFWVYFMCAAPSVFLGDSAELTTAMYNLGVAHPPGYPLYLLLGKFFTLLLPIGDIGFRANLFSGLIAAGCMALLYKLGRKLDLRPIPAAGGALMAGFSTSFWSQAVVAEVYSLAAFFFLLVLLTTIHWSLSQSNRTLILLAMLMGLSLTHHITIAVVYPVVLVFILSQKPALARNVGLLVKCLIALVIPLCLYFYIPIRARADIPNDWNNPETLAGMLNHILAGQYQGKLLAHGFSGILHQIKRFLALLPGQITLPLVFFSGLGVVAGVRKFRPQTLLMLAVMGVVLLFSFVYFINDIEPYFIPAFVLLALYAGAGLEQAGLGIRKVMPQIPAAITQALVLLAACIPLVANWSLCDRSDNLLPRLYGLNMLASIEPHGVLIAGGDNAVGILAYLNIVERHRQDVTIYTETQNIFRFPIFHNTYDPREITLAAIAAYERTLMQSDRSIYFTDIFDDSYPLMPHGIVYRVVKDKPDPSQIDNPWERYNLEGLDDPGLYDDAMTRVMVAKILLMRAAFLWSHQQNIPQSDLYAARAVEAAQDQTLALKDIGKFYLQTNRIKTAGQIFEKALESDPFDPDLHNALGIIAMIENRPDQAIGHFNYVIEQNPNDLLAFYNRAAGYERKADQQPHAQTRRAYLQNAMKDLQKALTIDPRDPQAQGALSRIYGKLQSQQP